MRGYALLLIILFSPLSALQSDPLELSYATTWEQRAWGLMGRRLLAPNEGMLFVFPRAQHHQVWAFNCYVDLDVAFLTEKGRILQIDRLKTYPEKMKGLPEIKTLDDMDQISSRHPAFGFFQEHSIFSESPTRYFLEVPAGWFEGQGLHEGDTLPHWDVYKRAVYLR